MGFDSVPSCLRCPVVGGSHTTFGAASLHSRKHCRQSPVSAVLVYEGVIRPVLRPVVLLKVEDTPLIGHIPGCQVSPEA